MRDYFSAVLISATVGAFVTALVQGSENERYVKYLVALICTVILISPLKNFIGSVAQYAEAGAEYSVLETEKTPLPTAADADSAIIGTATERLKTVIEDYIFSEFGIKPYSVSIDIESGESEYIVKSIFVVLEEKAISREKEIADRLKSVYGCETEVKH